VKKRYLSTGAAAKKQQPLKLTPQHFCESNSSNAHQRIFSLRNPGAQSE